MSIYAEYKYGDCSYHDFILAIKEEELNDKKNLSCEDYDEEESVRNEQQRDRHRV